jgi:FAD/FMN-containing dehydrogenase
MEKFTENLKQNNFKGEISSDIKDLDFYSHDASMFEIEPKLIVYPTDNDDVELLVQTVNKLKSEIPDLSLTARSGGTCMSGGAINDSVIVDFSKHFTKFGEPDSQGVIETQPGVYYRDFEPVTLKNGLILPSFPASREICMIGGMINNNSGGELSLRYGKTENFVTELRVVFADGKQYIVKPLDKAALDAKIAQNDFEGGLYKQVYELVDNNYDLIKNAKPKVTKNSTGYNLWDVWDRETGIFDLTKLIVGAQGTLGFVTDAKFKLVKHEPLSGVLVCFLKNIDNLGEIINAVMPHHPDSFESFDNYTIGLSIKFMPYFRKTVGWKGLIKLGFSLIPDALVFFKGIPKMILLIEFTGENQAEVDQKINSMNQDLKSKFKLEGVEDDNTEKKAWKFRIMRRESFNLLRNKVKDKHTAPFIDDLVVSPEHLVQFLPELRAIINKYDLLATVAGHVGDGNFHVIPLMKLENQVERDKIEPAMKEVNELVLHYGGSLSGEHNDGLIRGPWLKRSYGDQVFDLFVKTRIIFDPSNIFNPHKKTDADWGYTMSRIRQHF